MRKQIAFYVLILLAPFPFSSAESVAQESVEKTSPPGATNASEERVVKLTLHATAVTAEAMSIRLLPLASELKQGNAAVVLLRMPWEQRRFMEQYYMRTDELLKLEIDDPRIDDEFVKHFRRFHQDMRRAAYMRNADWNYPIYEEPIYSILLPDAQGMRRFAGSGMSLWVASKIAKGKLKEAENGILIQFSVARHVSRTPFFVCQLVGASIADMGLDRIHDLIQQPGADNYYYALSMLPEMLGDYHSVLEYESQVLRSYLHSLTDPEPPIGDEIWYQIAQEFLQEMATQLKEGMDPLDAAALRTKLIAMAAKELPEISSFTAGDVKKMLPEESVVRWILSLSDRYHRQRQAALSLPIPEAVQKMLELDEQVKKFQEETKAPATPFSFSGIRVMFAMHNFQRRVKMLQVVEAIRGFASRNNGQLPMSLADIKLSCPNDPMTGKPFLYEYVGDNKIRLSVANFPGIKAELNHNKMPIYEISIADD